MTSQQPRTFRARELREALALVRREFGPDAVILRTERVPGRALGLLGGAFVEVTAAGPAFGLRGPAPKAGEPCQPRGAGGPPAAKPDGAGRSTGKDRRCAGAPSKPPAGTAASSAARSHEPLAAAIRRRPAASLGAAAPRPRAGQARFAALRRVLLANMVPREICERWLSQVARRPHGADLASRSRALREVVAESLGSAVPLCWPGTRVAVFYGPTGVGKSTTLAKLATRSVLLDERRVGIVSLDDQRPGGTALLRACAHALDVPFVTVRETGTFARALRSLREADLVLVDTAGIAPRNDGALVELSQVLDQAGEAMTRHLCFAAATRQQELDRTLSTYSVLCPDGAVVTKVDEAVAVGSIFTAPVEHDLCFSFVTTGSRIPDDVSVAHPSVIADALLGEEPQ